LNYRSPKLRLGAADAPCMSCGIEDDTVVAAHSNQLRDGKGMGIKAHDYRVAYLCHLCHYLIDQGSTYNEIQKHEIWEEAHRKTIGYMFEQGIVS
jgi:hypothetical protein